MTRLPLRPEQQRKLFLVASGISTAGSFAGITAKGYILMKGGVDPIVLALNFAALSLPSLLISGPAGVRTDRIGCERVLIQAQWALLAAATLGALAIPLLTGTAQVVLLLTSTLLAGVAGTIGPVTSTTSFTSSSSCTALISTSTSSASTSYLLLCVYTCSADNPDSCRKETRCG